MSRFILSKLDENTGAKTSDITRKALKLNKFQLNSNFNWNINGIVFPLPVNANINQRCEQRVFWRESYFNEYLMPPYSMVPSSCSYIQLNDLKMHFLMKQYTNKPINDNQVTFKNSVACHRATVWVNRMASQHAAVVQAFHCIFAQ